MFICRITLNYYENNVINRQLITKNNIFLVEASLKRLSWSGNTVPDKIFKEGGALLDKKINKRPSPHVTVIKSHMRTFHADHLSACPHVKNARPHYDNCRGQGILFKPLVVETFEGWDTEATTYLKQLGRQSTRRWGKSDSVAIKFFFQRLSVTLQRGNAALILDRDIDHT